ncbi:MAG: CC_3452 family protein [Sphingomicrobium sp.]
MTRFATVFAVAGMLATPAIAGTYSAKPATAPAAKRIIGRDISWVCGPNACHGTTDLSRPVVLCQDLARRAGRIESFVADGRALSRRELDKCNTAAKDGPPAAIATAQ